MSEARDARVIADNQRQVERLSRLGWYHSIELPDGSVIEGHQSIAQLKNRICQFPIPQDLTGMRVLDIGAWDGWFSFEMERRGAEVLAVDSTRNTRLLEAKKLLGSRIDYHIADICRLTSKDVGTFDIVLFLGVLYHLKHPVMALENVCGMTRSMACIESFVTDPAPRGLPTMEFYETAELRGQLDNWVGPNTACLMAFCRTAGFARVEFESALAERAHVTGYRQWSDGLALAAAPALLCIENAATRNHDFSMERDDYVTFYFTSKQRNLTCDNVYPQIGAYGSRPIHVVPTGGGWQATCKLPPGLSDGPHEAKLRVAGSSSTPGYRIHIGTPSSDLQDTEIDCGIRLTRISDGKTFEDNQVRVGENAAISVWAAGLTVDASCSDLRVRLNGTDLPAIWLAPAGPEARQINALLPSGLDSGVGIVTVLFKGRQSRPYTIELQACQSS